MGKTAYKLLKNSNTSRLTTDSKKQNRYLPLYNLEFTENELASKLKKICNKNGKETNPKLSAPIFHELGKIYQARGHEVAKGSESMVCFIQSAALYNAALIRSPDNAYGIKNNLQKLCKEVLHEAGVKFQTADLIEKSKAVKISVNNLRQKVNKKLEDISPVVHTSNDHVLKHLQRRKISRIWDLQKLMFTEYKSIMSELAQYCIKVMGPAPCNFALVGMGSLAREEITPYSDFENVIILRYAEHNIQQKKEGILQYFRWFSVIFHIVLINLQETIIPSVGIFSLNNFYSGIKDDDWFYDIFTTSGICFDGMMPYACKFPLGRHKHTKDKDWTTELIKPVDEMLKYLSKDRCLKNGYNLNDVLTKTCFVFGDRDVYEEFKKGVYKILENEHTADRLESVKKQVMDDLKKYATRSTLFQLYLKNKINIKKDVYRSTTLFIAALGRFYNLRERSSFDIIDNLSIYDGDAKHKLKYAVAIACEIRLRWYMRNRRQAEVIVQKTVNKNLIETLFGIVGNASTINYFQIAYALQSDVSKRFLLEKLHFFSNPQLLNFSIVHCLNDKKSMNTLLNDLKRNEKSERLLYFSNCIKLLEEETNAFSNLHITILKQSTIEQFFEIGVILMDIGAYDDALEYFLKQKQLLRNRPIHYNDGYAKMLHKIGLCYIERHKPKQALEHLEKEKRILRIISNDIANDNRFALALREIGLCFYQLNNFNKASDNFKLSIEIQRRNLPNAKLNNDFATTLCHVSSSLVAMNEPDKALRFLESQSCVKDRQHFSQIDYEMGRCYLDMNQFNDAKNHFQKALEVKEKKSKDAEKDSNLATILDKIGCCFLNKNEVSEALSYFQRSLQIKQQTSLDKNADPNIASTLHHIGRCHVARNQLNDAMDYFTQSCTIKQRALPNADTNLEYAATLHEMGHCLFKVDKPVDALKYLEQSLEIKKRASTNIDTDASYARSLLHKGRCLLQLNEPSKALECLKESLAIRKRTSVDIETDARYARILRQYGHCYLKMDKPNVALKYLKQSLEIKKRCSTSLKTDTSYAKTLYFHGFCLLELNKPEEALQNFEETLEIEKRASAHHAETESRLNNILLYIGRCLLLLNKPVDAKRFFEEALEKEKLTSSNLEVNTGYADTALEYGRCLLDLNKINEALTYFRESLEIKKQTSANLERDIRYAETLNEIGNCLLSINKPSEANVYIEQALKIKNQV